MAGVTKFEELGGVLILALVLALLAVFIRFLRMEGQSFYTFLRGGRSLGGDNSNKKREKP